ncbi:M3 family metallopeptidase [Niabella drilacis]|uniref:Dipeptidyl carboxypeptidase n=1 Tax=Niabella drilacis (strain DSM 25811 / CCM 8410 / CCUG 62505 / LMG 26954 / E90) TaxID=1285928 RepID=A0A1G6L485_NIADE|nr:M3 family metallopeptidase [Niabella drilacis]SDC37921.1 peptidyl-dipeptidase Dcp [Niabella drilacis]
MKQHSIVLFILLILISCNMPGKAPDKTDTANGGNPLLEESTLPYQTIPFDKIKESDFEPAFEMGMRQEMEEVDSIVNNPAAPTFENTLVALERSGRLLDRTNAAFNALTSANTNDHLQQIQEAMAPRLSAHSDSVFMNARLYEKVAAIYKQLNKLPLDPESKRLVEYYHQKFVMNGAALPDSGKTQLKKLNEEEATLSTKFSNQLLAAAKAGALVVDSREELAGLPDAEIQAAGEAAKRNNQEGKYQIALINTTQQPALQSLSNRATRQRLFEASWTRAEKGDSNDTRKNILRIAAIRKEKARILGFPDYAAWKLQDQMAKTPEAVNAFLSRLIPVALAKAAAEAEDIKAVKTGEKDTAALAPYDWDFYSEKVRKAKYDLDESAVKPYFVLDSVLKNGVFYAATQLYGITFKERKDLPVYQEDVKVYEVFDKDGTPMALFYCDYFKRDNKNGGAWMDNFVTQSRLFHTKPVIVNVCNFAKPVQGQPALLSFDDVTTMFHEFGHALHGLFASQTYPSLSGTSVSRDFVEMPSQFNEHWALDSTVLKNYARNYKTGETIPQALVDKIRSAATFNQGYAMTELLAAAKLDMQWHLLSSGDSAVTDVDRFEQEALRKNGIYVSYVPPRYRSSYFLHIWANGYSAGYYAYSWAEMLDHDAYAWFKENGGLKRENGQRFRDMVLSKGNSEDLAAMYKAFRGKDPSITPLLENRGLVPGK